MLTLLKLKFRAKSASERKLSAVAKQITQETDSISYASSTEQSTDEFNCDVAYLVKVSKLMRLKYHIKSQMHMP